MTYNLKFNRWEGNENQFESEFSGFYQNQANPSTTTLPLHPTHSANHSRHHHTSSIPTGLGLLQPQAARSQPFLGHYQHQHSQFSRARQDGSPPRRTPALISQVAAPDKVQVEKGMVLDPRLMKWLKIDPRSTQAAKGGMSPSSLSVEDEDDPFAGIDDLPDDKGKEPEAVASSGAPGGSEGGNDDLRLDARAADEAFDVGEAFVKRHKAEEEMWMRRVQGWIGSWREELGEGWRWSIRERAMEWEMERAAAAAR